MSILKVSLFIPVPEVDYPLDETCLVLYLVGYYVGTSFRVIYRSNDFHDVSLFAQSCTKDVSIYKQIVNLQKLL